MWKQQSSRRRMLNFILLLSTKVEFSHEKLNVIESIPALVLFVRSLKVQIADKSQPVCNLSYFCSTVRVESVPEQSLNSRIFVTRGSIHGAQMTLSKPTESDLHIVSSTRCLYVFVQACADCTQQARRVIWTGPVDCPSIFSSHSLSLNFFLIQNFYSNQRSAVTCCLFWNPSPIIAAQSNVHQLRNVAFDIYWQEEKKMKRRRKK